MSKKIAEQAIKAHIIVDDVAAMVFVMFPHQPTRREIREAHDLAGDLGYGVKITVLAAV